MKRIRIFISVLAAISVLSLLIVPEENRVKKVYASEGVTIPVTYSLSGTDGFTPSSAEVTVTSGQSVTVSISAVGGNSTHTSASFECENLNVLVSDGHTGSLEITPESTGDYTITEFNSNRSLVIHVTVNPANSNPTPNPGPTPAASAADTEPTPDPTEPGPEPQAPPVPEISYHDHVYEWVTVYEATEEQDGRREEKCRICGDVRAVETIPAVFVKLENNEKLVERAPFGGTVRLDMGNWVSFNRSFIEKLEKRRDINLQVDYIWKHVKYRMFIPAGASLEGALDSNGYAGLRRLAGMYYTETR